MGRKTKNPSLAFLLLQWGERVGEEFLSVAVITICLTEGAVTLIQTCGQPRGPGSFPGVSIAETQGNKRFPQKAPKKGRKTCLRLKSFESDLRHQIPHAGFRYGVWMSCLLPQSAPTRTLGQPIAPVAGFRGGGGSGGQQRKRLCFPL